MQGHFEARALRLFWASLLPAAVVEVAVVTCLKSLLSIQSGVRLNELFITIEISQMQFLLVSASAS